MPSGELTTVDFSSRLRFSPVGFEMVVAAVVAGDSAAVVDSRLGAPFCGVLEPWSLFARGQPAHVLGG